MTKSCIGLIGNPNAGKSTLFNILTQSRQRIGNWPGVTVECKRGDFSIGTETIELVDLPGLYSLNLSADESSLDEVIASEFILSAQTDAIINILDAKQLERHLFLTAQLLEIGVPMIVVVNKVDLLTFHGKSLDIELLSRRLDCPVVAVEAKNGKGIEQLKNEIANAIVKKHVSSAVVKFPLALSTATAELAQCIHDNHPEFNQQRYCLAIRLLEGDAFALKRCASEKMQHQLKIQHAYVHDKLKEDADILLADARYTHINALTQEVLRQTREPKKRWRDKIDNIVLHRFFGVPIFFLVMYGLFFFAINVGGIFQDFFEISSNVLLVEGPSHWLYQLGAPSWLITILADGLGKGLNTVITFMPILAAMFIALAVLEDCGYMARAAFVIDRLMRTMGLPGKAFVPLIVGFGCNVPSVMGARTLENPRERVLTILMAPFMTCSARLAIFAVFAAAFFPQAGQNVIFALYLLGILAAVFTGLVLRKTLLKQHSTSFVMELPAYHWPPFRNVMRQMWQRLRQFIFRAGRLIVPTCIILAILNGLHFSNEADAPSLLAWIGMAITPIFKPMGLTMDNWPATVGLLAGFLAKEVVIASLNTLYTQAGHLASLPQAPFDVMAGLHNAVQSIAINLHGLMAAMSNPFIASAPSNTINHNVLGEMYQRFHGPYAAFAYLVFVLLYVPCISTVAVIARELNRAWATFSVFWSLLIAYLGAVGCYQLFQFKLHPWQTLIWLFSIVAVLVICYMVLHRFSLRKPLSIEKTFPERGIVTP